MPNASKQLAAAILALGLSAPAGFAEGHAQESFVVVTEFGGLTLAFDIEAAPRGLQNLVLTVDGPRGYQAMQAAGKAVPKIDLREYGTPFDGVYTWEITGSYPNMIEINTPVDENGRDGSARNEIMSAVATGGGFKIVEGQIMGFDKTEKEDKG